MDDHVYIFRDDIDEEFPLHFQLCMMPKGKLFCERAVEMANRIHWTTVLVSCTVCDDDTMLFTQFRQGKNILAFYEQCIDHSKPAYPPLFWLDENGS